MSIYIDTSVIVSALTREQRSFDAADWMQENSIAELTTSDWVVTEVAAALSIKIRTREISKTERSFALARLVELQSSLLSKRPILPAIFRQAAAMADRHDLGLRSSDSLHLAICAYYRDELCTLDSKMAYAGSQLGVTTLLL